jgi:hypothetical protein
MSMYNDFKKLTQIIEEDITKFHVHSHFLPILEEKSHHKKKYAKVCINVWVCLYFTKLFTELDNYRR